MYSYNRLAALSGKLKELSEPLFKAHDEYLSEWVQRDVLELREQLRHQYPDAKTVLDLMTLERNKVNIFRHNRPEYDRRNPVPDDVKQWFLWFRDPDLIYGGNIQPQLDRLIEELTHLNRMKLEAALETKLKGLPLVSIQEIKSLVSRQGLEGDYLVTLQDGTSGKLKTKSITAGGHTVQRFHFRYLMRMDPWLETGPKVQETWTPEVIGLLSVLSKYTFEPSKDAGWFTIGDMALRAMGRGNWGPLIKKRLVRERKTGVGQYTLQLSRQGLEALKTL